MDKSRMRIALVCFMSFFFGIQGKELSHYDRAMTYLSHMGEVNFTFSAPKDTDLFKITTIISIDKQEGKTIFAVANKQEFEDFLKLGIYYEVILPPSLACPKPTMSDYAGITFPYQGWDKYPTYEGYLNIMEGLKRDYPDKVTYQVIGKSVRNRDLIMAHVSTSVEKDSPKPKFLINAGIHGDETLPIIMSLRLIDWLCSNYGKDPRATKILDSIDLWISPMLNPDGTYKGGNNTVTGATRSNANNIDLNRNYTPLPGNKTPRYEPETKVFLEFEKSKVFTMQMGWHSGTEGISFPWSTVKTQHPDNNWYKYVSRNYANTAQNKGPNGFFDDINNGAGQGSIHLYPAIGTEKDCILYFNHCRSNCLESSTQKVLAETKLNTYWSYHQDAYLSYIQEVLHGISGTVTDSLTGKGLKAKIFVENHDTHKDSSFIYSDPTFGTYYRPIFKGTYTLTFSCPSYKPVTIENITVQNGMATKVHVRLFDGTTQTHSNNKTKADKILVRLHKKNIIISGEILQGAITLSLYNFHGKCLKQKHIMAQNTEIIWNNKNNKVRQSTPGWYILKIQSNHIRDEIPLLIY